MLNVNTYSGILGALTMIRTRDILITSEVLYQLSYKGIWWAEKDLNLRPKDYESDALPLSYWPLL